MSINSIFNENFLMGNELNLVSNSILKQNTFQNFPKKNMVNNDLKTHKTLCFIVSLTPILAILCSNYLHSLLLV